MALTTTIITDKPKNGFRPSQVHRHPANQASDYHLKVTQERQGDIDIDFFLDMQDGNGDQLKDGVRMMVFFLADSNGSYVTEVFPTYDDARIIIKTHHLKMSLVNQMNEQLSQLEELVPKVS